MVWSRWHWRTWLGVPTWVLLIGLLLTAGAAFNAHLEQSRASQAQFERQADQVAAEVSRRIDRSVEILHGLAGLFAGNPDLKRPQFKQAVQVHDLPTELPGVRGFGFVERVLPQDLAGFLADQQADVPGFALRRLSDAGAGAYFIVKFIEPPVQYSSVRAISPQ